jgi:hypothetical protein
MTAKPFTIITRDLYIRARALPDREPGQIGISDPVVIGDFTFGLMPDFAPFAFAGTESALRELCGGAANADAIVGDRRFVIAPSTVAIGSMRAYGHDPDHNYRGLARTSLFFGRANNGENAGSS